MTKIALCVEYNGKPYHGWQFQSETVPTVQGELEQSLKKIAAGETIKVHCAGRTDARVHASAQIVHFETDQERDMKAWSEGCNSLLPDSISVKWASVVDDEFHARFSATSRRYRYFILNAKSRPALNSATRTWHRFPLDAEAMQSAGQYLLGEHDFEAYRGAACQSHSSFRNVTELSVLRKGQLVIIDIEANAFLLHMVRNIVGVLLEVGEGKRPPIWAQEVLQGLKRSEAGVTAAPNGLHLIKVSYPEKFGIPIFDFPSY